MNLEALENLDVAALLALLINNEGGLPKIKVMPAATTVTGADTTLPPETLAKSLLCIDNSGDLAVRIGLHNINGSTKYEAAELRLEQLLRNLFGLSNGQPYLRTSFSASTGCISSFYAGTSSIGLANNGGDDWTITYRFVPDSVQLPDGVSITQISGNTVFYSAGDMVVSDAQTSMGADIIVTQTGNGAGVYMLSTDYGLSNGNTFSISRAVKVNASGTILQDVQQNGSIVNSTGCLTMGAMANVVQTGYNGQIQWFWANNNFSQSGLLGTGINMNAPVGANAAYIIVHVVLDATWNDLPPSLLGNSPQFNYFHMISIG